MNNQFWSDCSCYTWRTSSGVKQAQYSLYHCLKSMKDMYEDYFFMFLKYTLIWYIDWIQQQININQHQ